MNRVRHRLAIYPGVARRCLRSAIVVDDGSCDRGGGSADGRTRECRARADRSCRDRDGEAWFQGRHVIFHVAQAPNPRLIAAFLIWVSQAPERSVICAG